MPFRHFLADFHLGGFLVVSGDLKGLRARHWASAAIAVDFSLSFQEAERGGVVGHAFTIRIA